MVNQPRGEREWERELERERRRGREEREEDRESGREEERVGDRGGQRGGERRERVLTCFYLIICVLVPVSLSLYVCVEREQKPLLLLLAEAVLNHVNNVTQVCYKEERRRGGGKREGGKREGCV